MSNEEATGEGALLLKREPNEFGTFDGLPATLGELLELAIDDLERAERDPGYIISLEQAWHHAVADGCAVCMAGAVMAISLKAERRVRLEPRDFNEITKRKLLAINAMRVGDITLALDYVNPDNSAEQWSKARDLSTNPFDGDERDGSQEAYEAGPEDFKARFRQLAAKLKEAGL